jgi:ribosomal protein S18 acetylase RimI-like enzyme
MSPEALAERQFGTESWLAWVADPSTIVHAAVDGRRVVGFSAVGPELDGDDPGVGQLYSIYLLAEWWGQGVGHRLHAEAVTALVAAGFAGAVVWVLDSNARAIAFYEREGWRFDGQARTEQLGHDQLSELRLSRTW